MTIQQSRAVRAFRAQRPARWAALLAAWHAHYGEAPTTVAQVAGDIAADPGGPLARAYPADLAGAVAITLGKTLAALDGLRVPGAAYTVERGRYDSHRLAWYWSVRAA